MQNFPQLLRQTHDAFTCLSRSRNWRKCFPKVHEFFRNKAGEDRLCFRFLGGHRDLSGNLDFLVFDYLSEITMSLLTAAKTKTPNLGYAPDFVHVALAPFINDIQRKGIRVVSNAGGVNPLSCAEAIQEVIRKAGLNLKVAVVTGDDLMPHVRSSLSEVKMADGSSRQKLPKTLHSMNAYLGALPIKRCLDLGADIVVTGRCVDSAVTLAPLMHTFGWESSEYDLLAAGRDIMGFPVVEVSSDGSFLLSKPPLTGGLVSFGSVAEQLVYEISDPKKYLLPDVSCDFSQWEV
ncbi:Bifunctional protein GlmU [Dissostichus eleginoides]|uniref:Bifunctional protein GlmU n=1 Tax=Dissostichus eleginoides TaxID=100907 RepID=A0AAD9BVP9_DISEL|nr:Bifunctional protein GlmU [Dissostichus eleginoides]